MRVRLVFSLLPVLAAVASAGSLACVSGAASVPGFNPISTSGAVGDFTLTCTGGDPGYPVAVSFDYFLNAAVITPGSWILTNGLNGYYSGTVNSPGNDLNFQHVVFTPPGSGVVTWMVENIFVNPSQSAPGYQFAEMVSITGANIPISGSSQVVVAMNRPAETLHFFQGGLSSAPVPLPSGQLVGDVTGTISDDAPQDYYSFYWNGGAFSATATINGASSDASYLFSEGVAGSCYSGASQPLNSGGGFTGTIATNLAAGQYCIGIEAGGGEDPPYDLTFNTPVTGQVPEPSGFVLLSIGLAAMGVFRLGKRSR